MHNALYHYRAWFPKKIKEFHADDIPDLTGKVALVTGGATDVGFEVAKALARANARVLVLAEKEHLEQAADALEQIRQHCLNQSRGHAHLDVVSMECDFASLKDVKRVADAVCQQESRLDIVRPFSTPQSSVHWHTY
ncbi:hypothetical protein C8Q80DRAFT_1181383 [Daedaleopsis nitida]|nr:hypothetical protein C8Q80DRAFT_1181383 [Daedaleopsis nitida]